MNAGVSTTPCGSVSLPLRAAPSLASTSNCIETTHHSSPITHHSSLPFNKHRIAVAVEAVALIDGVAVRAANIIHAAERGNQHEQGGLRQVEIGEQALDDVKAVAGRHEEPGFAAPAGQRAAGSRAFE